MASSEVALVVEEEKTQSKLGTTATAKSATKYGGDTKTMRKWPSFNPIFNPKGKFLMIWKNVFVISCVVALLVDPLFLYIPITNQDMKCIGLDQNLKIVTLFLRSAVDLPCIVHIISQILAVSSQVSRRRRRQWRRFKLAEHALEMAKRISWLCPYLLIDILAILPIPQVVILILLTRTRGSKSLNARKFLNSLVIFQYVPRAFRMYRSCKEANKTERTQKSASTTDKTDPDNWNGYTLCLKVYKFILASHVFGALWYYFSAQREMDCWQYACGSEKEYEASTFDCDGNHTLKNVTFLNNLCPINIPNSTLFDFGIFLDVLQSGTMGSTDFPQKILQYFWWGLRSLSSFGQNLETSTYAWENLFALYISITGMILFLIYLNAILQKSLDGLSKKKEKEKTEKLSRKMKMKDVEVDLWLNRKGLPSNLKEVIMNFIQQKLEQNEDVEVENILSVLPSAHRKYITLYLRLAALKKVRMLQTMGVKLLKAKMLELRNKMIWEGGHYNPLFMATWAHKVSSIEKEIRRRRQGKRKHSIKSLNKLSINQGSASKKLQHIISKVMRDQLPSPVSALDRN
ncbi:hypothetical protein M0R45_038287 [Rubus argutus]|uniref:Uncharacterized protein n=1 Tax=Rubus argutus TaxID=59490 RepID=A0AAW1W638_RUBAR